MRWGKKKDVFVDLGRVIPEIIPSLDAGSRTVFDLIYLDMSIDYLEIELRIKGILVYYICRVDFRIYYCNSYFITMIKNLRLRTS